MDQETAVAPDVQEQQAPPPSAEEVFFEPETGMEEPEKEQAEPEGQEEEQVEGEDEEAPKPFSFAFGDEEILLEGEHPPELVERLNKISETFGQEREKLTQSVKEKQEAAAAYEERFKQLSGMQGELLDKYSKGMVIREQLERFNGIDLNQLWHTNPDQARQLSDQKANLERQFQQSVQEVSAIEQAVTREQMADHQRQMEEGRKEVERRIPGFAAQEKDIIDYTVKTYGLTPEQAATWPANPNAAEMAYKAMQWDKLQQKAQATIKPKPGKAAPVRPLKAKGGKAPVDPDKLSPDQWVKWREKQLAKKRQ